MENELAIQLRVMSTGIEKINDATSAVNKLDSATNTASGGGLDKFGKTMQSAGSRLNVLGQRMTWMVTVPLVAFGNKAIETALDIEKAWVSFSKVFSGTEEDFKNLQIAAEELSNKFGRPIEDVINVMEEFNKAGIDGVDNLSNLGRIASETAITFDMELTDSLQGVKSVMMGYGLSVGEAEQAMADINIIADKTTASESGVLEVFNRAAGTARQAGFSIQELAASQGAFEKSAIPAGRAGNAMKSILVSLTKQSNVAKDQFLELGINMSSAGWRTADASEKFEILSKKFLEVKQSGDKLKLADLNEAMASLVGKFQVNNLNVLLEDMSNNFDDNADTVSQYYEGLKVATDATENMAWKQQQLDKVMGSSPQKMAALSQEYRNMTAEIGEKLLPIKVKLMETLIKLLEAFNNMSPSQQDFIIKLGLIAAAAGPVLAFVGLFTSGLGFLLSAISTIISSGLIPLGTAITGSTGVAAAFAGFATVTIPLVTAALLYKAVVAFKQLQQTLKDVGTANEETRKRLDGMQQRLNTMEDGPAKEKLKSVMDQSYKLADAADEIKKRYEGIPGAFRAVGDQIYDWFKPWVEKYKKGWGDMVEWIKTKIKGMIDLINRAIAGYNKLPGTPNINEIRYKANGGLVYAASGYLAKGNDTVPAMLSPGEMVLNRSQQSNLFDMISGRKQMQTAGGATVNINVGTMVASRGEQREFARKIKELLEEDSNRY